MPPQRRGTPSNVSVNLLNNRFLIPIYSYPFHASTKEFT